MAAAPCPVCGKFAALDPSYPGSDSTCPTCGHLLWRFRDRHCGFSDVPFDQMWFERYFFDDLGADSLDIAELVMEMEEEFGVEVPDEELSRFGTAADAIRCIPKHLEDAA